MLLSPYSDVLYLGQKNDWVDVENVSLPPHRDISSALGKWIDRKMYLPETIQKAAAASSNPSDQDSRIREYDVEDRDEVQQWMGVGAELMLVRRILEVCCHFRLLSRILLNLFVPRHSVSTNRWKLWGMKGLPT